MADPAIAAGSAADAGAFLARLVRLDPTILVRLRPAGERIALWARLPFDVLVTRAVAGEPGDDATVRADELLAALPGGPLPARRDTQWRGALPPPPGPSVESVPADVLRRLADAAGRTVRESAGRGIGERMVRDVVLDHAAITLRVGDPPREIPVPTRLVTALARMGFLAREPVRFGTVGSWLVAHATFGSAWYRKAQGLRLDAAPATGFTQRHT